ncbi:protein NRT1/ PTR FAMILY 5.2-like isoform X1 [Typha angustifolia]|uniref:protein NRT1/ PTR FAMILY 5.2-like isoform X1 n=2 Tax=Typha angustifolia TaxID=59011 RepID=UPI003C2B517E
MEEDYAKDGSVDLKGNPVLRSKRGGWSACCFLVVYEVFDRMAYFAVSTNLLIYLTRKLHQGTVEAANNVTNWAGVGFLMPVFGGYIADAYLGRYWTFVISSLFFLLGMCLLTVAVSVPSLKPPPCDQTTIAASCEQASALQSGVFFTALYILAVASGGTKPNISTIGADQFDDFEPKEKAQKASFFNWWMCSIFTGTLLANTLFVYVQDTVGWSLGYGLPTVGLLASVLVFFAGTPLYRHKVPQGSPLTKMAKVLVAAVRKRRVPLPKNALELHELELEEYKNRNKFRILSTDSMRFLNKAAVKNGSNTPWMLSTVTEVEETKQMLKLTPIFLAMIVPATTIAQVNTLFVKQGTTLNRHIGSHFQLPPASLLTSTTISMLTFLVVYDLFFIKIMRTWTKNPRGITLLQRIGVGLVLHIITMLVASITERNRLRAARIHGVDQNEGGVPLTIFILLPQYVLMGVGDGFLLPGELEFFYDQAPESMKSFGTSYSLLTYGIGDFLSSVLLTTVSKITAQDGKKGWISNNLNSSHLDYYYAFLTMLSIFNFIFFCFVAKFYSYKAEVFEPFQEAEEYHEAHKQVHC